MKRTFVNDGVSLQRELGDELATAHGADKFFSLLPSEEILAGDGAGFGVAAQRGGRGEGEAAFLATEGLLLDFVHFPVMH